MSIIITIMLYSARNTVQLKKWLLTQRYLSQRGDYVDCSAQCSPVQTTTPIMAESRLTAILQY
jgi:hypothetical protein